MGKVFALTPDIISIAQDALDDLLAPHAEGGLAKTCQLIYPPVLSECVNCIYDPIGDKSSNRWITGGPMPFPDGGICPVCNDVGKLATTPTENIQLGVQSDPAHFYLKVPFGVRVPAGTIQTKGFITDLPKVLQAQEMIVAPGKFPIVMRYVMDGEPIDTGSIIQSRYWFAFWKRVG